MFEPTFIADSYSCRKGKGTLYGIHRLQHHIRSCSCNYKHPCYALKMDIQGYFMNIRRSKLLQTVTGELQKKALCIENGKGPWISRLDYSLIHYLMAEIIMTDPTKNCIIRGSKSDWDGLPPNKSLFHTPEDCGLPIGNLTSQLFSNIYLNTLDQYVKRSLHEKHYGRYVDDSFIVCRSYSHLKERMTAIRSFLKEELGLVLHPKKTGITQVSYGINYLGVFVKPYRLYIHNKTARRMKRKIAAFRQCTDTGLLRSCINSYLGYLKHLKCGKLKRKWMEGNKYLSGHGYFTDDYSKFILNTEKQIGNR